MKKLTWKLVAEFWEGVLVGVGLGAVVVGAAAGDGVVSEEKGRLHGNVLVTMIIAWVMADAWATEHTPDFSISSMMHPLVLNTTL